MNRASAVASIEDEMKSVDPPAAVHRRRCQRRRQLAATVSNWKTSGGNAKGSSTVDKMLLNLSTTIASDVISSRKSTAHSQRTEHSHEFIGGCKGDDNVGGRHFRIVEPNIRHNHNQCHNGSSNNMNCRRDFFYNTNNVVDGGGGGGGGGSRVDRFIGGRKTQTTTATGIATSQTKLSTSLSSSSTVTRVSDKSTDANLIGETKYVSSTNAIATTATATLFGGRGDFPTYARAGVVVAVDDVCAGDDCTTNDEVDSKKSNNAVDADDGDCNCVGESLFMMREFSQTKASLATLNGSGGNRVHSQCRDKCESNHLLNGSCRSTFETETSSSQVKQSTSTSAAVDNWHNKNYNNNRYKRNNNNNNNNYCSPINETKIVQNINQTQVPITDHRLPTRSLVAQRKLDLVGKFELQRNLPCRKKFVNYSPSDKEFPSVDKLVQLYTNILKEKSNFGAPMTVGKMVVKTNETSGTGATNTATSTTTTTTTTTTKRDPHRSSPLSDEGCTLGQSPYSSDCDDNESIRTASTTIERKRKDKVARCASSDSALGLDVDDAIEPMLPPAHKQGRRMTLTVTDLPLRPALLPLAEPTALPDSPINDLQMSLTSLLAQTAIPSKVLLEERVVEIPEDRYGGGSSISNSRRESSQSCVSDYFEYSGAVRYVRTPSVVVSDYSDDVMCGITLEEIEYFRAHRMRRRRSSAETTGTERDDISSEISASSSCSNLYYCGSTISALDGAECYVNGIRMPINRKTSDCSTFSVDGDNNADTNNDANNDANDETIDDFAIPEQTEDICQIHRELVEKLSTQHISTASSRMQSTKKVGINNGNDVPLSNLNHRNHSDSNVEGMEES